MRRAVYAISALVPPRPRVVPSAPKREVDDVCDTVVFVPERGPVWFAKNSDREPSEAQFVECHDRGSFAANRPKGLPEARGPGRSLLSRPAWMWGAEIGVNEHGVAIGNEAVFTRMPVPREGYSGMDFLRVALANARTVEEALDQLIELVETLPQGGRMGHRHRSFRYHSSFLIADQSAAWALETAGEFWAAKRVHGVATISNALTIGNDFDRVHPRALSYARGQGWVGPGGAFHFANAFSDRKITVLAGADIRRACTASSLRGVHDPGLNHFIRTLTDHGGTTPGRAWRSVSPCAHASWLPTMTAAQTTSSVIARLDSTGPEVWATGTSSPCLSVFKPAPFDPDLFSPRAIAEAHFDRDALWWAHERLHRECLHDYTEKRAAFAEDREVFQASCVAPRVDPASTWRDHRTHALDWHSRVHALETRRLPWMQRRYWSRQSKLGALPGS